MRWEALCRRNVAQVLDRLEARHRGATAGVLDSRGRRAEPLSAPAALAFALERLDQQGSRASLLRYCVANARAWSAVMACIFAMVSPVMSEAGQ